MSAFTKKRVITVPSYQVLKSKSFQRRLYIACRNLPCSRRNILDEISFALIDPRIQLTYHNGLKYAAPDNIDRLFGDEPELRWYSSFLEENEQGDGPKRYSRHYGRLELLAILIMVRYPRVARHLHR